MTLVIVFIATVLVGAAGAIFALGWLAGLGLAGAILCGVAILWQLAAMRPSPRADLPDRKCPNPTCGQTTSADSTYCPRCGRQLTAAA